MGLYTMVLTAELGDDSEAAAVLGECATYTAGYAEVVEHRWFRDGDAEVAAALAGVEWGGR